MWFGESEKIIKVFSPTINAMQGMKGHPSFFNEADAIFARRMQEVTSPGPDRKCHAEYPALGNGAI